MPCPLRLREQNTTVWKCGGRGGPAGQAHLAISRSQLPKVLSGTTTATGPVVRPSCRATCGHAHRVDMGAMERHGRVLLLHALVHSD